VKTQQIIKSALNCQS